MTLYTVRATILILSRARRARDIFDIARRSPTPTPRVKRAAAKLPPHATGPHSQVHLTRCLRTLRARRALVRATVSCKGYIASLRFPSKQQSLRYPGNWLATHLSPRARAFTCFAPTICEDLRIDVVNQPRQGIYWFSKLHSNQLPCAHGPSRAASLHLMLT